MFKKSVLTFLLATVLIQCLVPTAPSSCSWENDKTAVASRVIDGDTFDTAAGDRVRLADIDAPESGESGYYEAKNYLSGLVYNEQVYLDIDDVYGTDKYGRLVCVVYVDHSATEVCNVNKALLVEGHAVIWNFNNEFDPYTWSLYCPNEPGQESQTKPLLSPLEVLIIAIIVIGVIVDIYLFVDYRKRKKKSS